MPKRLCPFECDLVPQSKVHISEKEIRHGDSMKSVFDKTLRMLFVGAKRTVNMEESDVVLTQTAGSSVSKHNYKQMFLNNQCQLQYSGTVQLEPRRRCQSCCLPRLKIQTRCMFCEKVLCVACIVTCATCSEEFCQACSIVMYRGLEDEHLCLGCCR